MLIKQFLLSVLIFLGLGATLSNAAVPEISNPRQAPIQRTLKMEEIWRIGDDSDEPFILGVIRKIISDQEGNFYLLDTQQSEVFKFSPDGQYLKSVSRKGEGPGELGRCYFFGFWDANTVACFSRFPHKFIRFDLEGIPVDTLTPLPGEAQSDDGRMAMSSFIRRDGFLVVRGSFHSFENGVNSQKSFLSGFDNNAEETICYDKIPTGYDFTKPIVVDEEADFIPFMRWTLGQNGEVYTAPQRTEYLLEVHDGKGNLLRTITRDMPLNKRTDFQKEEAKNQYSFGVSGRNMPEISYKISDYPRSIGSLNWIDDQLWIVSDYGIINESSYVVDVFDGEGHLLEERTYLLPMDRDKDRVHWLADGRAMVVKNYQSAQVASRNSSIIVQRGDEKKVQEFADDLVLEVILYQVTESIRPVE